MFSSSYFQAHPGRMPDKWPVVSLVERQPAIVTNRLELELAGPLGGLASRRQYIMGIIWLDNLLHLSSSSSSSAGRDAAIALALWRHLDKVHIKHWTN